MIITNKLKERFCKDMNIPIKIFKEPYFTSRMNLFNRVYPNKKEYDAFVSVVNMLGGEQNYFTAYDKVKQDAINYLINNETMGEFIKEDINKFSCMNIGFPKSDIYNKTNDGKLFLSIDMKKANFTALHHYNAKIVGNKSTYEDFLGMFTEIDYFKKSKYIRQIIFGNVNTKRQMTYEKYLMDRVLSSNLLTIFKKEDIKCFLTDEIVICLEDYKGYVFSKMEEVNRIISDFADEYVPLKAEVFYLDRIKGTINGYIKRFQYTGEGVDFKGVSYYEFPFVLRAFLKEPVEPEDYAVVFEGMLATLNEKIDVSLEVF